MKSELFLTNGSLSLLVFRLMFAKSRGAQKGFFFGNIFSLFRVNNPNPNPHRLLFAFVEKHKAKVHASYFVSGSTRTDDGKTVLKMEIVPQTQLEGKRVFFPPPSHSPLGVFVCAIERY